MPPVRQRYEAARWAGLGLVVVGLAAVGVVLTVGGPHLVGVLALVPIVAGAALFTVSSVRWWDLAVATARAHRIEHQLAVDRGRRGALALAATLSVLALVVGVAGGALPALRPAQPGAAPVAVATGPAPRTTPSPEQAPEPTSGPTTSGGGTRGAEGFPVPPFPVEDGAVTIGQVDDEDAWWAVCGAVMGDSDCSAWGVVSSIECDLEVVFGFADSETGPTERTEVRSVRVRPGTAAFVAAVAEETWTSVDAATCRPRPDVDDSVAVWTPTRDYEVEPEGCWDPGCIGFDLIPTRDCARADVQFAVYDEYGGLGNPHDLVTAIELHDDVPVTVWAGGIDSFEGDAVLTRISCH